MHLGDRKLISFKITLLISLQQTKAFYQIEIFVQKSESWKSFDNLENIRETEQQKLVSTHKKDSEKQIQKKT